MTPNKITLDQNPPCELGRIWRQRQQRDVGRHAQCLSAVPAGLIERDKGMLVGCEVLTELGEKQAHRLGRDLGHHQREPRAGCRVDDGKQMHPSVATIAKAGRARTTPPPTMADAAFLTDPGLVLEPQGYALVGMCLSRQVNRCQKPPF